MFNVFKLIYTYIVQVFCLNTKGSAVDILYRVPLLYSLRQEKFHKTFFIFCPILVIIIISLYNKAWLIRACGEYISDNRMTITLTASKVLNAELGAVLAPLKYYYMHIVLAIIVTYRRHWILDYFPFSFSLKFLDCNPIARFLLIRSIYRHIQRH